VRALQQKSLELEKLRKKIEELEQKVAKLEAAKRNRPLN
jgi:hypothetical protein